MSFRIEKSQSNTMDGYGTITADNNKRTKRLEADLAGQFSGVANHVAYMPAFGNVFDQQKGVGQAATQV